ncbi:hypothetical protein A3B21_05080 [Candidatus Uhrbacteria bacterium RIFCSPLOWO2_01_FULL_47_24]|uniref:Polymerase nucleotidyl transferase domain-containing protein n=1 Tax=Candidatus Uhrbacteria bacterium RIFCSPLOWO2_01_FULL_47_24 TaxID=1802401 RepID=A0A1F7UUU7_9BACT|nr:MAG: hypothetical protein A2753_03115 [Candidatus Uhrbacteria bacterium RIFCSPHIGHO2_01_FULL_47_11]OGL69325.1 MAG: hypothetical protein A3D58_03470 [Candidatus Uhrbacteria bacterium RIFCSPHIGHO2_02_FULL_46_47]OGL76395.1 MAG: hypothetical protein A3F52_00760 [Candidatus Uhrbacteria bacterium RIFCSPHIGHO2_12_FULL_47_11]OGL82060.1 MAG: hypothetical protein A3B21_05080 [Candidatus Uhrbacteria bacterium RIFCSPLOWO2_01_FULL_47_24]OGL85454.1 MAG: hypothetical protein A3J03_05245 [Candidatus Uhrbact
MKTFSTLKSKEQKAVATFTRLLREALRDNLIEVKLFGSRVRGAARHDSDIDILVVVHQWNTTIDDTIYDLVAHTLEKLGVYLSVKVFPQEEYERLRHIPTVFFQLVSRDAIPI